MQIRAVAQTDVGRVRQKNEDAYLVDVPLGLFVVADGMGGHSGGRVASDLAVQTISASIKAQADFLASAPSLESPVSPQAWDEAPHARCLADAVREAAATIFAAAQADIELTGMGTTVTAVLIRHNQAFVAHVGDSRCYLQRGERIAQITDDHSLVSEQLKAGLLSPEAARKSQIKNIITRSVGYERDVAVDTFAIPLVLGDLLLLCSDGLSNWVDDAEIGVCLRTLPFEQVADHLVALACDRGGDDNLTVVCLGLTAEA